MTPCDCRGTHAPRRVVLTGGPGAGKTAALELVRWSFCAHVRILPEAASLVFSGGFPRDETHAGRRAAQQAIFHVQRALEEGVAEGNHALVLCDRGTIDGTAYWPGPDDLFTAVGTTFAGELARYEAVVHMRTPGADKGYDQSNPLRVESATEAARIDEAIARAWGAHPRRAVVPASSNFMAKLAAAAELIRRELPACCGGTGTL